MNTAPQPFPPGKGVLWLKESSAERVGWTYFSRHPALLPGADSGLSDLTQLLASEGECLILGYAIQATSSKVCLA
jgi:hypothetical protein